MNLLPKSSKEFSEKDYWDQFFKKRGKNTFDWYGEYPELCVQVNKYVKTKDFILVVGCGNSKLSMDMFDVGYTNMINVDISPVVIKQMKDANARDRPELQFIQMDATNMSFKEGDFSVVLDKGTLDALMSDNSFATVDLIKRYFAEIQRVLRVGGRYVCISLLQEHILNSLLEYFPQMNFMFRVVRCLEAEQKTREESTDGTAMPVFMAIATKFKALPMKILEVSVVDDTIERVPSPNKICEVVKGIQNAASVCNGLSKGMTEYGEVSMELCNSTGGAVRYTIHILDLIGKDRVKSQFAAFIVPQGRETEWMFSTPEGRKTLIASAKCNRLAVVSMHRDQKYGTLEDVQTELSPSIKGIAPHRLKDKIPFLSIANDVGSREIVHKGCSEFSGDYVIEDVDLNNGTFARRLVFMNNQTVIQSEALIKIVKNKNKKGTRKIVDLGHISCEHHLYIIAGIEMMSLIRKSNADIQNTLVVGLGGGGLCSFVANYIKNVNITAVDIDPDMMEIATKYFGAVQNERLQITIDDGINYLTSCLDNNMKYNTIVFDVDSKDSSLGMSCPPQQFISNEVLQNVSNLIENEGLFILNLVCRDSALRVKVMDNLKKLFSFVCAYKLKDDVNEIIYCTNNDNFSKGLPSWKKHLKAASTNLNDVISKKDLTTDTLEIDNLMNELKI